MTATPAAPAVPNLAALANLSLPDAGPIASRARSQLEFLAKFEITGPQEYTLAAEELMAIKSRRTTLEAQRTAITGPINHALRAINALFRGPDDLLEQAETLVKGKMLAYEEAERARIEAERKVAEEQARRVREEAEAQARAAQAAAQQAAKAAEQAAAIGDAGTANALQARAEELVQAAQAAETTATMAVPVVGDVAVAPKVAGVSRSTTLSHEVVSVAKLIAFIATGNGDAPLARPELAGLLVQDEVRLRAYVKGLGELCNLPGVRVFQKRSLSASRGGA